MVLQLKFAETSRKNKASLKSATVLRRCRAMVSKRKKRANAQKQMVLPRAAKKFFTASSQDKKIKQRFNAQGDESAYFPRLKTLVARRLPVKRRRFTCYPMIKRS